MLKTIECHTKAQEFHEVNMVRLKLRHCKNITKFEKIYHTCFEAYSVTSKQVDQTDIKADLT